MALTEKRRFGQTPKQPLLTRINRGSGNVNDFNRRKLLLYASMFRKPEATNASTFNAPPFSVFAGS